MAPTFFLAHASRDADRVDALHQAIVDAGETCFLDRVDVPPGDSWDQVIPGAHERSRVTLVTVSDHYDAAFYLRNEVHDAIRWMRQPGTPHRVVPIFLDGIPERMPYGLTVVQGLDLAELGLEEVVRRLIALARGLPEAPPPAPPPPPARDRLVLYRALCRVQLATTYFDEVVQFVVPQAADQVPTPPATPATRASALVQWAALQTDEVFDAIWSYIEERAPGAFE